MEYSNESGITAYTYGNERLLYETNGVNYKYNYDGRGSVTNLLDNTGASVVEYNYQPFGETEILGTKAQEQENTYQFNAESTDALAGLQYLRARYYDSKTGRFTSADTYLGEITDPLSRNLYLYTKNDPVNYVDPSGHIFETIGQIAQTVQGMAQGIVQGIAQTAVIATAKQATQQAPNSAASSIAKSLIQGAVTAGVSKKARTSNQSILWTPPAIENNVSFDSSKKSVAATIMKIEQNRGMEEQIIRLRRLNTKAANQRADELQNEMKKMCTSNAQKIMGLPQYSEGMQNPALKHIQYFSSTTPDQRFLDDIKVMGYGITGMVTGILTNFIGGNIALGYGIGKAMKGEDFVEGMQEFNEKYINPGVQNVKKELANNSPAFDGGYIEGNLAATAASLISAGGTFKTAAKTINIFTTTQSISQGTIAMQRVLATSLELKYITCTNAAQLLTSVGELSSSVMFMKNGGVNTGNGDSTGESTNGINNGVWDMQEGGEIINGREYSQHALERMAPDTPQVRAELTTRAHKTAENLGYKPGTPKYYEFVNKYVDPRNIPPSVVEGTIRSTIPIPGNSIDTFIHETADLKVIVNSLGKVISVYPK